MLIMLGRRQVEAKLGQGPADADDARARAG